MKVALIEVESIRPDCINKDFMGGYGWAFHIGKSLPARMIEKVKKKGEKLPLLDFAYIAAIFKSRGHQVEVCANRVPDADLALIHASMIDYRYEISWAQRIRRERPQTKIGFIGPFAGFKPNLFLADCDFVIAGEPESAAMRLSSGEDLKGIVSSEPVKDLDSLPFPAWELFPINQYSYFPALRERPFLPMLSSRGCVYSCDYCPYPVNYKWRERGVDNVLDEMEMLVNKFKVRGLLFRDPLFSVNRKRAQSIAEGIIRRKIKIKWACETRTDLLNKEILDLFFRSGLRVINVGVESSDEDVLKQIDRIPIPRDHQEAILRHCDNLGIRVTCFYVLGLPLDSKKKIMETVSYAKKLNSHAAMFYLATPFPGTEYYNQIKTRLLTDDFEKMDCFTPVVSHPEISPAELEKLKEWAYVSYYFRPRWALALAKRALLDLLGN